MSATRSRREEKTYRRYLKNNTNNECEFCGMTKSRKQVVAESKSFLVIKNIFPYSLWDNQAVADHLMIIPKDHTDTLATLTDSQAGEYLKLLSKYELLGYNVYARAPSSIIKTVAHQHTHLIKPRGKARKVILFLRKPYIRFIA